MADPAPPRAPALLITCEHGGCGVPRRYRPFFAGATRVLASHRGFDAGALAVGRVLARRLGAPLLASRTTRLLVDLNRSRGHPRLFSAYVAALSDAERERVIERFWTPHRESVRQALEDALADRARVVHVASHSFTPVLDGRTRGFDVGLLFDPARRFEARLASLWRAALHEISPGLAVRFNAPYRGTSDGLTTTLRGILPRARYAGIELEVNQRLVRRGPGPLADLAATLADSLGLALTLV